jgi:hypothetical protein
LKIALATIFYQNNLELQRLVDSIPDKVIDFWITVDGPFRFNLDMYPDLPHKSDDGSLMVLSKAANKFNSNVIINYKTGATEFDKRNTYLENCEKLKNNNIDALIIVDSDEYFYYEPGYNPEDCWTRFKKNLEFEMRKYPGHNVFGIDYIDDHNTRTYKPRVWVNPHEMRYFYGSHYMYGNIKTDIKEMETFKQYKTCYCQPAMALVKGLTMKHDHVLRSKEYQERRKKYQQYLVRFEELIQSHRYSMEEADKLAKEDPATGFDPT